MREPEWNALEREVILESRRVEFAPRGRHGMLMAEATDPSLQTLWEVPLPTTDFVAAKLHREQERYFNSYPAAKEDPSLLWRVEKSAD